jgi:predicted ATPase
MALALALTATRGFAAPEVEQAYLRARACYQEGDDLSQLFTVLRGLWLVYLVRGKLPMAYQQAEELLRLTQGQASATLLLEVHRVFGTSCFFLADLPTAWSHLQQGMAPYEAAQHRTLTERYGQDPGMACLLYAAWVLWLRGYPDQALAHIHQALALAQHCQHPICQAYALLYAAMLHWLRREMQAVFKYVDACLCLAHTHAFPVFVAMGTLFRGGVLSEQGAPEQGLEHIRWGIAAYRATGAELFRPYFLGMLAAAYGRSGQVDAGLQALAEALSLMDSTGERLHEAELYRLQGTLLLQSAARNTPSTVPPQTAAEAEACFQHALSVARRQQAKSLELRAALCLSSLWQQQGQHRQAYDVLKEVTDWFTEGLDTGDLQEARQLLATLS